MRTTTDDGRNIDVRIGRLEGEAAPLEVKHPDQAFPLRERLFPHLPSIESELRHPTYYEQPVVKEPVWIWTIPTYFYVGGVAGAAGLLGACVDLTGGDERLARRCHLISAAGDAISAALLIGDLGKPSRFLNMLRTFNPRSPMSIGSWVLSASGAVNALAVLSRSRLGKLAGLAGGLLGMPLAGYTAVLLSNSAVPVWQASRRTLPLLFMSSAIASAGSLLQLLPGDPPQHRAARRYAVLGQAATLASTVALHREGARAGRAGRPLARGASGALVTAATALTAASLAVSLWPGTSPRRRRTAAVLGTLGALALRFGIFHAGKASARDPRATFLPQRQGRT